ncbi:hypothetical protein FIBSPDRAFT_1038877 [Athelia psychrophila]|uniref:Uncharacterized protein n=1 Tax=Athelia psychrophila TaxID=1759441 RepID=A0A166SLE8_9AGAM|nr:hypothetical protein FIBSPDRAFT_1038877 [Fibularhizoctonia sp. CBS 109695]
MASIDSPSNPDVLLKCYAVPYGVLDFTISVFILCYNASNHLGYNIWTPWTLSPPNSEIRGPASFFLPAAISYRAILGVRDVVRLAGCCVALAVSAYTVYKCDGSYQLIGIWRMTDVLATILYVSVDLYTRNLKSSSNFLVSVLVLFILLLYIVLRLAGPIVGLIGLKNIAQEYTESHRSLRTVAYVFLSIGLTQVVSLTVIMSLGSFTGKTKVILKQEEVLLQTWLRAGREKSDENPEISTKKLNWLKKLKKDDEGGGGTLEWTQSVSRSSGVYERMVTIAIMVLFWSVVSAVYFEGWYIDWMLAVVTDNIPGVPHHRALGIVYAATVSAYTLI